MSKKVSAPRHQDAKVFGQRLPKPPAFDERVGLAQAYFADGAPFSAARVLADLAAELGRYGAGLNAALGMPTDLNGKEITLMVSGPVGCGKSAILAEVENALIARGIPVRYAEDGSARQTKNASDFAAELQMYRPKVVLVEHIGFDQ